MYLGIDIGSSSSKAALINENKEVVGTRVINLGTGTQGVRTALDELPSFFIVHPDIRIRRLK